MEELTPIDELREIAKAEQPIVPTQFGQQMEAVKETILKDAGTNDEKFIKEVTDKVKASAVKNVEVEEGIAQYKKDQVATEQKKVETEYKQEEHKQAEALWENRERRRLYHYNGVKPIMTFVGIHEPLYEPLMYFLTAVILPFYLVAKLFKGTIGALVAGACDSDRPKAVKGFLWTLIGALAVLVVGCGIYFFLKWQNIISL